MSENEINEIKTQIDTLTKSITKSIKENKNFYMFLTNININDYLNVDNINTIIKSYKDISKSLKTYNKSSNDYKNNFPINLTKLNIKETYNSIDILLKDLHELQTELNKYEFLNNIDDTIYSKYYNALKDEIDYLKEYEILQKKTDKEPKIETKIEEFINLSFLICDKTKNTHETYRCLGSKKNLMKCNGSCNISKKIKKGINNKRRILLTKTQRIVEKGRNFFKKIRNYTKKSRTK